MSVRLLTIKLASGRARISAVIVKIIIYGQVARSYVARNQSHVARNSWSCRPILMVMSPEISGEISYEDSKKCRWVENLVRVKCETKVVLFDITEILILKLSNCRSILF